MTFPYFCFFFCFLASVLTPNSSSLSFTAQVKSPGKPSSGECRSFSSLYVVFVLIGLVFGCGWAVLYSCHTVDGSSLFARCGYIKKDPFVTLLFFLVFFDLLLYHLIHLPPACHIHFLPLPCFLLFPESPYLSTVCLTYLSLLWNIKESAASSPEGSPPFHLNSTHKNTQKRN